MTDRERIDAHYIPAAYKNALPFTASSRSELIPFEAAATGESPPDAFLWSDRICAIASAVLDARMRLVVPVSPGYAVTAAARIGSSIGRKVCCGYDAPRGHLFFWGVNADGEDDEEDDES